jgi:ABC-type uncharacterized transport system permease subunit
MGIGCVSSREPVWVIYRAKIQRWLLGFQGQLTTGYIVAAYTSRWVKTLHVD